MVKLVIIEKTGNAVTKNVASFSLNDLYKKCNYRKSDGFNHIHSFHVKNKYYLHVYGKEDGKANQENKFDFPPPIDNDLFFGAMAILKSTCKYNELTEDAVLDYSHSEWNKDYETLMGGFEDIGSNSEDDYESDELKQYPKEQLTTDGYLKDGFVVEDADESEEGDNEDDASYGDTSEETDSRTSMHETEQTDLVHAVYSDSSDDECETDSELSEEEYDSE